MVVGLDFRMMGVSDHGMNLFLFLIFHNSLYSTFFLTNYVMTLLSSFVYLWVLVFFAFITEVFSETVSVNI